MGGIAQTAFVVEDLPSAIDHWVTNCNAGPFFVLDHFKMLGHINAGYNVLFVVCGSAYLLAWIVMRVIRSSSKAVDIAQLSPTVHS